MMVSGAMVVKEQTGCVVSGSPLPTNDSLLLDLDGQDVKDIQLKEQFAAGDDFALKARKPYTITKQRERWTEEEHKKFLEALKLYGRAWRRIEEHVGTKTAVQIRSHAQKFFSKVVRESNIGDGGSVKPIEIPPPRPKRKPMHPYPRKMVSPVKTGILIPEKPDGSIGQENQSPTSVLSTLGSDQSVGADSYTPNRSLSPVSSALARCLGNVFGPEAPNLLSEDVISSQSDREDENSSTDEEIPLELDLSHRKTAFVKGYPNVTATQSLKLFGKTLLVVESSGTCKTESFDKKTETSLFPLRVVPLKTPANTSEDGWCASSNRSMMQVCSGEMKNDLLCIKITGDSPNLSTTCAAAHFPWLTLHTDASHSTVEVHSPTPIRVQSYPKKEKLDSDEQKEGSSTDSNTDSFVPTAHGGKVWETSFSSYKLSKRVSANTFNCRRGFVPYKRCFTEQDCTDSSMETAEEREKQRIRLCL